MHNLPRIYGSYKPKEDCFLKHYNEQWCLETCRETLQKHLKNTGQKNFYFCAGTDKHAQRVVKFFKVVEAASGVEPDQYVKFEITSDSSVLYVQLSDWWNNHVRQSLLTVFLRCGRYYSEDSANGLDCALNSVDYAADTRKAIDLFLSGNTAIKNKSVPDDGDFKGWHSLFYKKGFDPSRILVRIKRKKEEKPNVVDK